MESKDPEGADTVDTARTFLISRTTEKSQNFPTCLCNFHYPKALRFKSDPHPLTPFINWILPLTSSESRFCRGSPNLNPMCSRFCAGTNGVDSAESLGPRCAPMTWEGDDPVLGIHICFPAKGKLPPLTLGIPMGQD